MKVRQIIKVALTGVLFGASMILTLAPVYAEGQYVPNVIVLAIDGASRQTVYSLLAKRKLPSLQRIAKRGNFRNAEIAVGSANSDAAYARILNVTHDGRRKSIFDRLGEADVTPNIAVLISSAPGESMPTPNTLQSLPSTILGSVEPRSIQQIETAIISHIETAGQPFLIIANFPSVDAMARRSREGGEYYADEIRSIDQSVGRIQKRLKFLRIDENTEFLVTAPYAYAPKSREIDPKKTWVLASRKINFKGTQQHLGPTILDFYNLDENLDRNSLFAYPKK